MSSFSRTTRLLMAGTACMFLASCDGADSVASPGEGGFVVVPGPQPTPTPTAAPPTPPGTPAASCPGGFEDGGVVGAFRACRLPRVITAATTLRKLPGVAYELNGQVDVGIDVGGDGNRQGGVRTELTIQPGVIVFANTANANNDFLVVNRGSRMNAVGTAAQPIIFTADANLTGRLPLTGAALTDEAQGLWGGIIMAGRAPISNCNQTVPGGSANCESIVEGTTSALYGGATADDDSGTVRYVQIRYSGTVISPNNELQGLTLAGTGSGTTIDHVQVHNSSDDGIEIFGGRTNLKYLALTGSDDDAFDTDVGWQGFAQFVLAVQKPVSTQVDNYATEIDSNNNEDALPRQRYNLANFTFVSTTTATNAVIRLRGGADARFLNGIVTGPTACLNIVAGLDAQGKSTIRPANAALEDQGPPIFNSVVMSCANPYATTTVNNVTVTVAEQEAVFNAGTNNVARATGIVTGGYLPAGVALTTTPFAAATVDPFFVNTSFIGAVSGPNDTAFAGWTCNSNRASFGPTSASCLIVPTN